MKRKKIISLVLVFTLALSLVLTGCGAKTETPQQPSVSKPSTGSSGIMWDDCDLDISVEGGIVSSANNSGGLFWSNDDYEFNTSEYEAVKESNFLSTKTSPLSTFAADVDTASYTNLRAILNDMAGEYSYYYDPFIK